MKAVRLSLAIAATAIVAAGTAGAQTATQSVTYQVAAINQVAVTGTPTLVVNSATAGSAPNAVTDATSTWAITTNGTAMKVTAAINTAMPTGVTLEADATAPTVGTSAGFKSLSTTATDVVTGITQVAGSALTLSYRLTATLAAGVVASASKTVTYTIVQGP
jgi:hypothetical protein